MNHHAFESPPREWDEQEAMDLHIERVAAEILRDIGHYDSLIESLASDTPVQMLLWCIYNRDMATGMNKEVQASMWDQAVKLAPAEIERRQRQYDEDRAAAIIESQAAGGVS